MAAFVYRSFQSLNAGSNFSRDVFRVKTGFDLAKLLEPYEEGLLGAVGEVDCVFLGAAG